MIQIKGDSNKKGVMQTFLAIFFLYSISWEAIVIVQPQLNWLRFPNREKNPKQQHFLKREENEKEIAVDTLEKKEAM